MSMTMGNKTAKQAFSETQSPYILVQESGETDEFVINDLTVYLPGSRRSTLVENLNMRFKRGEKIVLTGESGTGKTTIAKAFLNQWDYGKGSITMPRGLKIMAMSQDVYFADLPLRDLLANSPDGRIFDDTELTRALIDADLPQLVQHIPGQQTALMMRDLIRLAEDNKNLKTPNDIETFIEGKIPDLVAAQFDIVQYTPQTQRDFFHKEIAALIRAKTGKDDQTKYAKTMASALCDKIDIALLDPLFQVTARFIDDYARINDRSLPITYANAANMASHFGRKLSRALGDYMANKDTDDKSREIYINKKQAAYLAEISTIMMRESLKREAKNSTVSQMFNAVSWPLHGLLHMKASTFAQQLMHRMALFMDKNIVRGDMFKMQLSGGQRQKLMFARILLHKPDVLVLDEITAALDVQTGEKLYKLMLDRLPKETTVISIAHNPHIKKYHTLHAHLDNKTITMTPIARSKGENELSLKQT